MNTITLIGNLGKDAAVYSTKGGKSFIKFSMATKRKWEGKEFTTWHDILTYNNACRDLKSGDYILVIGELQTNSYEKDGKKIYQKFIKAQVVAKPLSEKKVDNSQNDNQQELASNDDVPF